jgi:hypothetical protein
MTRAARAQVRAVEERTAGPPAVAGGDDTLLLDERGWNWDGQWD